MSSEQHLLPLLNQSNWIPNPIETEPTYSQNQSEAGHNGWELFSTQQMPEVTFYTKSYIYTVDRDLRKVCRVFFSGYVVLALCIFGLLGNSVTILVLKRDPDKARATVWLLKALAVIDTSFLFYALLYIAGSSIWDILYWINEWSETLYYLMQSVFQPMAYAARCLTIWIAVLVTIDRYLAICKPLNASWRNLRRMKIIVLVLFILAVLLSTPLVFSNFMRMHYKKCLSSYSNHSRVENYTCHKFYSSVIKGLDAYAISYYLIFRALGPLIIIVILNLRMAWALRTLKKKRRQMMRQIKSERNIAMMLVVVVVVFILCHLPSAIMLFVLLHADSRPRVILNRIAVNCASTISVTLEVLNSSINFLIYCLISRRFDRTLCRMFTCRKRKRRLTVMTAYISQRS